MYYVNRYFSHHGAPRADLSNVSSEAGPRPTAPTLEAAERIAAAYVAHGPHLRAFVVSSRGVCLTCYTSDGRGRVAKTPTPGPWCDTPRPRAA